MRTELNNTAAIEYGDSIAETARGKSMADVDCGLIANDAVEIGIDLGFGNGIERGSWFIEDNKRRVFIERTGKCDLLRFAAGDLHAVLFKITVKICFRSFFELIQTLTEIGFHQALSDLFFVIIGACRYVLTESESKKIEILEDNGENGVIFLVIILTDINAVEQDLSFRWIVKTAHEFDHRGFARTVHTHNGKAFTDLKFEIDVTERPKICIRIFERNIAELNFIFTVITFLHRERTLNHVRRCFDEIKIDLRDLVVVTKRFKRTDERADRPRKFQNRADILRDRTDRKTPHESGNACKSIKDDLHERRYDFARNRSVLHSVFVVIFHDFVRFLERLLQTLRKNRFLLINPQSKLVRCTQGTVLDVVVDIRKGSPTYGQHITVELTGENHRQLFIPRGFAHGFAVLSDTAVFQYKCDNFYAPQAEAGIQLGDEALGIDWRIPMEDAILSGKDLKYPLFSHLANTV